jgi:mannosyltransferase OCH1-like enzyme
MSNGLPIICRNTGGNPNAIGNNNFLCNNDKDFFINLLKIDDMNYSNISNENILKIKKENDEDIQFNNLINIINTIHSYENQNDIPNIIHYVYGLEKLNTEFPFVYYISILSNLLINKPIVIYFHYQYEPFGIWWEKIKKSVKLNYINADNIYWGNKKILNYAHKSDKIRLEMLYKYGGIYMDIDTISFKSYSNYLSYDFVIGIQSENYGKDNITLYCNAILLSKKNNIFIKNWIEKYEYYFDNNDWCKASVHLPHKIFDIISLNDKKNIKVLEKECFYYPSYNETNKIFENDNETNEEINEKLITLHLWNTYSHKYFKDIDNFDWNNGSLYSKLLYNIRNLFYTT